MSVIDWIKNLLGGADEHVQNLGDNEVVQNIKDQASEVGGQAEELKNNAGEQVQNVFDNLKDKLGQ